MNRNRNNQDFDDFMIDDDTIPKRPAKNNKPAVEEFNFLDDEDDNGKPLKLPVIKQDKNPQSVTKPKSRQRDSANEKQKEENRYFEEVDDDLEYKSKNVKGKDKDKVKMQEIENHSNSYGNNDYENQNYEQEFENYDNDFEEEEVEQIVEKPVQKKQDLKQKEQRVKNPPKAQTSKNIPTNKSVNVVKTKIENRPKQMSLYKSQSRKSVRSGRTNLSLRKAAENSAREEERKFSNRVEKNFPETNVDKLKPDEVEKLNEKARAMIRELNNQLNEILNKVTLDQKKPVVSKKNVDDTIKLLVETKKNNLKILDRGAVELKKLQERAGSIKDQQYQMKITTQIASLAQKKKEYEKAITQMKVGYNIIEKKTATISSKTIESVKNNLIHLRKEVEKSQAKDEQLQKKLQAQKLKTNDADSRYKKIVQTATDKGIQIQNTAGILAKIKELEQKEINLRKNVDYTTNVYKTKGDIMNNDNQRIKRDIVNCQAQVKDIYSQIVELANKSSALIEKEKENPKLMKNVLHSLEVFSKSIANPPPIFEGITSYDVNSPAGSVHRRNKNSSKLSNDSELTQNNNQKSARDIEKQRSPIKSIREDDKEKNNLKPNFKKDKHVEQKADIVEAKQAEVQEMEKQVEKTKVVVNNLKPTFNFRKKHENKEQPADKDKPHQSPKEVHKQSETPVPAPSATQNTDGVNKPFTRFRRNQPSNEGYSLTQPQQQKVEQKQPPAPLPVVEPQQPTPPKRFMLKRRGTQEDNNESSGYNPTVLKNDELSKQTSQKPEIQNESRRFGNRQQQNKNSPPSSYQPSSYQPTTQPAKYQPTSNQSNPPPRIRNFSNRPKEPQQSYSFTPNQPSVPTPPKQQKQVEAPKPAFQPKQREGRIKKEKISLEPEKKGGNIYSHAEDLTNEFMAKDEPKTVQNNSNSYNSKPKHNEEELDINKLIGNNKRKNDDDDDIVFEEKKTKDKKPMGKQNQNDFFGFDL